MSSSDIEKQHIHHIKVLSAEVSTLDVNQSSQGETPLDWPSWVKSVTIAQVVTHAAMASWCASAFIPAFFQMSLDLRCPIDVMTYLIGSYTLMLGFGAFLWNPLSDRFGRRPIMLGSLVLALVSTCGVAVTSTYATIMTARIFQGLGLAAPLSLGAAYIKDMYGPAHRGMALGVWTLGLTSGPFIAPLISGFMATSPGWRWILWLEALILACLLLTEIILLPESLVTASGYRPINSESTRMLFLQPPWGTRGSASASPAKSNTTAKTLHAATYIPVWIASLAFSVPYGYIAVSLSSLFPSVYGTTYQFSSGVQGLLYLPMLIGSVLAEVITGRLGDWFVLRSIKDGVRVPENRLLLAHVGSLFSIVGLVWFGVGVEHREHWSTLALGTGVAAFGAQIMASVCMSYIIDCYPTSAKEVSTVIGLFRALSAFVVLFYNQQLLTKVGYAWGFGIQAFVTAFFSLGGLTILQLTGEKLR